MSFEVHVEQQYLGATCLGHCEALFRARGFEDVPALSRQRHPRGRPQPRVIVRNEDGRRLGTSSRVKRAEVYVVGLERAMRSPLLGVLSLRSSGTVVTY